MDSTVTLLHWNLKQCHQCCQSSPLPDYKTTCTYVMEIKGGCILLPNKRELGRAKTLSRQHIAAEALCCQFKREVRSTLIFWQVFSVLASLFCFILPRNFNFHVLHWNIWDRNTYHRWADASKRTETDILFPNMEHLERESAGVICKVQPNLAMTWM